MGVPAQYQHLKTALTNYVIDRPEVAKAQSEAPSATSAIAKDAFCFDFYFEILRKLRCGLIKFVAL